MQGDSHEFIILIVDIQCYTQFCFLPKSIVKRAILTPSIDQLSHVLESNWTAVLCVQARKTPHPTSQTSGHSTVSLGPDSLLWALWSVISRIYHCALMSYYLSSHCYSIWRAWLDVSFPRPGMRARQRRGLDAISDGGWFPSHVSLYFAPQAVPTPHASSGLLYTIN